MPKFAPAELKMVVKYFPLPLSNKSLAETQFTTWEMGNGKHSVSGYGEKTAFEAGAVFDNLSGSN